ncbi:DUF3892 domain-containing protein [Halorubrum sp. ASP1]|uniref:DUF3892 domain-containing protein n=1 Tax=Halorubrum sp. ASP1 TaxID=2518114 RepID=UPI0010F5ED5E|nr:DUF3892 domain-containing protein [Halorubrum sp. ASP1]TKX61205.1 DUF3892 domain-containing protein [Halorubrum sp. ASP1]
MADSYIKKVEKNSDGDISKVAASGTLSGEITDLKLKTSVVRDLDSRDMTYVTAYKKNGKYVVGDEVHTVKGEYIRTDGNNIPQDDLGNLPTL